MTPHLGELVKLKEYVEEALTAGRQRNPKPSLRLTYVKS